MTTVELIATLRKGAPITSKIIRDILSKLERLDWAEGSLRAALETYGQEKIQLTELECHYVCEVLDDFAHFKSNVRWMLECDATLSWVLCERSEPNAWNESESSYYLARQEVEKVLKAGMF